MKNQMWKTLFISLLTLICQSPVEAKSVSKEPEFKCGTYEIKGVIREDQGKTVLKLYEGSMSETILTLGTELKGQAAGEIQGPVTLKGRILTPVKNYRGHVDSIVSIQNRVPDPLRPMQDSGFKLMKLAPCAKRATKKK